jgi:hypothetical protein
MVTDNTKRYPEIIDHTNDMDVPSFGQFVIDRSQKYYIDKTDRIEDYKRRKSSTNESVKKNAKLAYEGFKKQDLECFAKDILCELQKHKSLMVKEVHLDEK